jgi:hemerythrin-like domain-containing protein
MELYLSRGIKEVVTEHPEVGEILSAWGIACVTCGVGTCLLKDVVEVHGLSLERERDLLTRIAGIIFPGREVEIPKIKRKIGVRDGVLKYSPPMQSLVDEHSVIKRMFAFIPGILEGLDVSIMEDRRTVLGIIDFIRSYADKFHHAKEEDILFGLFQPDLEILKVMNNEHTIGRGHVKAVLGAIEKNDNKEIAAQLSTYRELLTAHIRKEDEVLYPWMDEKLSMSQVGELFSRFAATDMQFREIASKQEAFVKEMEEITKNKEELANV